MWSIEWGNNENCEKQAQQKPIEHLNPRIDQSEMSPEYQKERCDIVKNSRSKRIILLKEWSTSNDILKAFGLDKNPRLEGVKTIYKEMGWGEYKDNRDTINNNNWSETTNGWNDVLKSLGFTDAEISDTSNDGSGWWSGYRDAINNGNNWEQMIKWFRPKNWKVVINGGNYVPNIGPEDYRPRWSKSDSLPDNVTIEWNGSVTIGNKTYRRR